MTMPSTTMPPMTLPPTTKLGTLALVALLTSCGSSPSPSAIEARIAPSRIWYHTGQDVLLTGVVEDATGEPLEDVSVRWTAEGAAMQHGAEADPRSARFTLTAPGTTTFTGCVENGSSPPTLCDSVTVRVDDGMPSLELESPAAGAELSDPDGIVVRGSVADQGPVRIYVDGLPIEPDEMGGFEVTVPAHFGVNHLVVEASDGLTEPSRLEMDVLWAPSYAPALADDGRPELTLQDGLALRLGQRFFDDGAPLDPTPPIVTEDLADLLELVVLHADVSGLLPDPVVDSPPTFTLRVRSVVLGAPRAELALVNGGAELFLRIADVQAETEGALTIEGTSLPLEGTITASAVAHAELTVRKEHEDAEIEVALGALRVGIESLDGTFDSEETAAVFRLAEGLLRTTLETTLVDAVRGTVESSVPAVLRDALEAVDGALAGQQLALDSAPFPAVTIQLDGRMASLATLHRREMLATLRTTIGTDVQSLHPESRGVARLTGAVMAPEFFRDGALALGVRLELLNGLLHALYGSGLLEVDVTPLLPDAVTGLVSEARLAGRMAPLLRPTRGDEADDLILSVGQLELEVRYMGEPARFAVSLDAGVRIDVTDNRIALAIAETPRIHVWPVAASNPRGLTSDTVKTVLNTLWPDLRAQIADGLAFELPLPALGDLGGLAPELAGLALELEPTERVRVREGVLVLDARLLGRLP